MTTPEEVVERLKQELELAHGSFLSQLRPNFVWDAEAFVRLTEAMEAYCRTIPRGEQVDLWIAHEFWYVPAYVRKWTSHPGFPRQYSSDYYDRAYDRLDQLAWWYFTNSPPFVEGHAWKSVRP